MTADTHNVDSIDCKFDETRKYLKDVDTIKNGKRLYSKMDDEGKKFVYRYCFKNKESRLCPKYIVESDDFINDEVVRVEPQVEVTQVIDTVEMVEVVVRMIE